MSSLISIQETFFSAALHKYSILLEDREQEQLIFKHSISAAFLCRATECLECCSAKAV